jgi:hypothetical protein
VVADVPAEQQAVTEAAAAMKLLELGIITDEQAQAILTAQATGQWVLQNPLQNYVWAPTGPYGMMAFVNKDTLPFPFNMMGDIANTPFDLTFEEEHLLTDFVGLQIAADKAAMIMGQRMETNALLSRMQVALNKANATWGQIGKNIWNMGHNNERFVRIIAAGAESVEDRTMQVRIVALEGMSRNGVLISDAVSGKGIFVTVTPATTFFQQGQQFFKVENWVIARRGLVADLMGEHADQIQFLPPISLTPEPPESDEDW